MKRNLISQVAVITLGAAVFPQMTSAQSGGYPQQPGYPQQVVPPPQPGYPQQVVPPPQQYPPQGGYPPNYSYPQQQGYAQPGQSQYVSPMQFLPTFGRKFGEMFRRVFYGDTPPAGYNQPAQAYPPPQGRLDQPPAGQYQPPSQYPAAPPSGYPPRYETPPPPSRSSAPAMGPTNKLNSGGSTTAPSTKKKSASSGSKTSSEPPKNYTPPSISRKDKARMEEEPPPSVPPVDSAPAKLPGSKPQTSATAKTGGDSKPNAAPASGTFLRGKKTGKEGRVISPYPPYRELDVSGLSSGSLALDPTTQKVFEVP